MNTDIIFKTQIKELHRFFGKSFRIYFNKHFPNINLYKNNGVPISILKRKFMFHMSTNIFLPAHMVMVKYDNHGFGIQLNEYSHSAVLKSSFHQEIHVSNNNIFWIDDLF